jgi:hypothetical protein
VQKRDDVIQDLMKKTAGRGPGFAWEELNEVKTRKIQFWFHKPMFNDLKEVVRPRGARSSAFLSDPFTKSRQYNLGRLPYPPTACSCEWCIRFAEYEIELAEEDKPEQPVKEVVAQAVAEQSAQVDPLVLEDGRMIAMVGGKLVELTIVGEAETPVIPTSAPAPVAPIAQPSDTPVEVQPALEYLTCEFCDDIISARNKAGATSRMTAHIRKFHEETTE